MNLQLIRKLNKIKILIAFLFIITFTCLQTKAQVQAPYSIVDDKVVIPQFQSVEGTTSDNLFLNALLWTIQSAPQPEEKVLEVDYDKKQFGVAWMLDNPKTACRYRCVVSVKVADNIITMLASDISQEAETAVIKLVKRLPFEKLNPEKKPKHKDYLTDFSNLYEKQVSQLMEFVTTNQLPPITHWREIKENDVVKGMNPIECILSLGKPASVQKQGSREEWMYDAYTYVFFDDGFVSSVIK